jgi:hypothetical protein
MSREEINEKLKRAEAKLLEALHMIDDVWRDHTESRTPRLSEAVSLLERAGSKLKKEGNLK